MRGPGSSKNATLLPVIIVVLKLDGKRVELTSVEPYGLGVHKTAAPAGCSCAHTPRRMEEVQGFAGSTAKNRPKKESRVLPVPQRKTGHLEIHRDTEDAREFSLAS